MSGDAGRSDQTAHQRPSERFPPGVIYPVMPTDEHWLRRWHWLREDDGQLCLADWHWQFGWHWGWSGKADPEDMEGWHYVGPAEIPTPDHDAPDAVGALDATWVNQSPPAECWRCKRVRSPFRTINIMGGAAASAPSVMKPLCEECSSLWPITLAGRGDGG